MRTISAIFLILAIMAVSLVLADESNDKTISGSVSSLDWLKSLLTIRFADSNTGNTDDINLTVTSDSELTRGAESISFSDINQGDPVTVTYYYDDAGGLKIRRLADLNYADK